MVQYDSLNKKLAEKGLTKSDLTKKLGISSRTIAKIAKGEKLSRGTLQKIGNFLSCDPSMLWKEISDNPILQILREEKEARISGGLYHELQVRMTYNSNHIEGSRLTEYQTRVIFETNTVNTGDGVPVDDILETIHHFKAIDYVIDVAEEDLTEEMIKHLHYLLKHDTKDASLSWFAVGDYKKRANFVEGHETAKPKEVMGKMQALLSEYLAKEMITFEDIVTFHFNFEHIHPFQDGNGRVGRLITLKECLNHNIIPFIIEDSKKAFYYRGLSQWNDDRRYLIDTCLDGQDTFIRLLDLLGIPH